MTRGWHYTKLSLSSALLLSFSGLCSMSLFLYFCRFLLVLVLFLFPCSRWSFVDIPLIFSRPEDHVLDWQPRILLGMAEDRSVINVKNTKTTIQRESYCWVPQCSSHRANSVNIGERPTVILILILL